MSVPIRCDKTYLMKETLKLVMDAKLADLITIFNKLEDSREVIGDPNHCDPEDCSVTIQETEGIVSIRKV